MIVPSKHENLPFTIMESLACGTPVVAFNIGGNADMIDHKENGYLVKPFDIDDLTKGINWCLENNTEEKLSINARNKVLQNFSIENVTNQHVKLYKSILE
jgi:glycosyltransferase involved in cell wall biosynthesis